MWSVGVCPCYSTFSWSGLLDSLSSLWMDEISERRLDRERVKLSKDVSLQGIKVCKSSALRALYAVASGTCIFLLEAN